LYTVAKFHLSNNVDYTVVIECMQLVFEKDEGINQHSLLFIQIGLYINSLHL